MGPDDVPAGSDARHIEMSLVEPPAFGALFERHAGSVHRYLVSRVGAQSAEDLVGETFVTAFRARSRYDLSRPDARPWLFGIATNLVRHHWRSQGRTSSAGFHADSGATAHDHSDDATSSVFFSSQHEHVAQALAQLDDAHLDVLLLVAGPGFTYEEVSVALGIPIGTVRSRMSRARRRLRELLGGPWQYLDGVHGDPQHQEASAGLEGTNEH